MLSSCFGLISFERSSGYKVFLVRPFFVTRLSLCGALMHPSGESDRTRAGLTEII
jgi:hypothetical protein